MKNLNDTIGNRSRDLPVCSAVPQPLRHRDVISMYSTCSVINCHMLAIRAPSGIYPVLITFDLVNTITEFLFVVIISVWTKCHYFGPVTYLDLLAPGR
jgi:hypothetical protein